jgi:hypothetical protein
MLSWLGNWWNSIWQEPLTGLVQLLAALWNASTGIVINMININPQEYQGGTAWGLMVALNPIFVSIASGLLTVFFLMQFCQESVNLKEDFNMEKGMKLLIKVVLCNFLVKNTITIIQILFGMIGALCALLGFQSSMLDGFININRGYALIFHLTSGESFVGTIFAIIAVLACIMFGYTLIRTVYYRFFKIYIAIPFAPVGMATLVNSSVAQTGVAYIKSFLAYTLEVVVMILAFLIGYTLLGNGGVALVSFLPVDMQTDFIRFIVYLVEIIITLGLVTEAVKLAESTIRKLFGL